MCRSPPSPENNLKSKICNLKFLRRLGRPPRPDGRGRPSLHRRVADDRRRLADFGVCRSPASTESNLKSKICNLKFLRRLGRPPGPDGRGRPSLHQRVADDRRRLVDFGVCRSPASTESNLKSKICNLKFLRRLGDLQDPTGRTPVAPLARDRRRLAGDWRLTTSPATSRSPHLANLRPHHRLPGFA